MTDLTNDQQGEYKREPMLSEEYLTKVAVEAHDETHLTRAACVGVAIAIRDFYEEMITSGELMVVRTCKNENMFMELHCSECGTTIDSDCPGACVWNQERYEASEPMVQFCPGCGAKIV